MPNVIDRLVGFFNPAQGLRRHVHRQLLTRAYEGASKRDGWNPRRRGASANTDHAADAGELRTRSRALHQNVPYVAQALRTLVSNVVGTGITPSWKSAQADVLSTLWARWANEADADGRSDIYGLQAAAYRAMEQDGEVLIRLRPRLASDKLAVPLQLQLLEIDWLDSFKSGNSGADTIVNGIQYDPLGRVSGYWLFDEHPGEQRLYARKGQSRFIPAQSIIHLFTPERPGQGRGFPRIAPVIARVRDLQLYEDAELARKNLEARLSVLASGDVTMLAGEPEANDPGQDGKSFELGTLGSGSIVGLPPGMTTSVVQPKVATGYVDYLKFNLHLVAAGYGVTYEAMTGDVSEVNFSSARVRLLDFRRECEVTQWHVLIPKFCERVVRAFEDAAYLAGKVTAVRYGAEHSTPKWNYVNPEQDVRADIAEISGGLSSISEKLRQRGYKPAAVFAELAQDIEALRSSGILDTLLFMQKGRAETPADSPAGAPAPAAPKKAK